eukprot:1100666-Prymnesium_polylepis.1
MASHRAGGRRGCASGRRVGGRAQLPAGSRTTWSRRPSRARSGVAAVSRAPRHAHASTGTGCRAAPCRS